MKTRARKTRTTGRNDASSPAAVGVRVKLNDKVFFCFGYSSIGSQ